MSKSPNILMANLAKAITVCIADDHLLFQQSLESLLGGEDDISIIGKADSGQKCYEIVKAKEPDVTILDISMPGMTGLEVSKKIKDELLPTQVLILSMHNNPQYVYNAFKAGCKGYMLKSDSGEVLKTAIRTVHNNKTFISSGIASDFVDIFINHIAPEKNIFTHREKEICDHIAKGQTTKQIAYDLCISPKTVRVHLANIMKKLSCKSRSELLLRLLEAKYS